MQYIDLKPRYLLDYNWNRSAYTLEDALTAMKYSGYASPSFNYIESEIKILSEDESRAFSIPYEERLKSNMEIAYEAGSKTKIGIARHADTEEIIDKESGKYKGLATKLGMIIKIPDENVTLNEVQFNVALKVNGEEPKSVFIKDGFPNSHVEVKHLISGALDLNISNLLDITPSIPGVTPAAVLKPIVKTIKIDPITFKFGPKRKISTIFSGPLESWGEWYFKGFIEKVGVALTINKPEDIKELDADITANWKYIHNLWPVEEIKLGTATETIPVYPT